MSFICSRVLSNSDKDGDENVQPYLAFRVRAEMWFLKFEVRTA